MNARTMVGLLRTLRKMRTHESWTRLQLAEHQAASLRHLRAFAYEHSRFYQRFHAGVFDRPLQELPILTKAMLMEGFEELATDRTVRLAGVRDFATGTEAGELYLDRYRVAATSGSSGHPGFFLFSANEWVDIMASFARAQEWSGARVDLWHRQRMATVASISPWHISAQVAATAKSWWRPSLRLPASQPLSQTVPQLEAWDPQMLIAYASMIGILAEEQIAGRLNIHPRLTYASSEILTSHIRERAKEAWGNEPYNQYAATETASIAAEHRDCRRMHVFEDLVIAEVVDERGIPVPPGEYGAKVLVTTLFSRTQPLIRYELDDSIRMSVEPHSCSLPFATLEDVRGRVEDTLQLPAVKGGAIAVRPLVFNRVMDIAPVTGWQVVQQADNGLVLLIVGGTAGLTDESLIDRLIGSLTQEGVHVPYVRVRRVDAIPKTAAGKTLLVRKA